MYLVEIIGSPVACKDGIKETWRDVATWAASQLHSRYGEQVEVKYYDLFDKECPPISEGGQLPIIRLNGKLISSGGKVSVPLIRKAIDDLQ